MASGVKSDISHDAKAKGSLEKSLKASKTSVDDPYGVYSLHSCQRSRHALSLAVGTGLIAHGRTPDDRRRPGACAGIPDASDEPVKPQKQSWLMQQLTCVSARPKTAQTKII